MTTSKIKDPHLQRVHLKDNCDYARQRISTLKTQMRRLEAFLLGVEQQAILTDTPDKKRESKSMIVSIRKSIKALEA